MIPQLYVDQGDEVVLATEGYPLHEQASLAMAADVKRIPLRDFCYDVDALLAAVSARTKIIWLCSPNNPTGTVVKLAELESLLGALPPTVVVVIDGAYAEFVDDPEYGDAVSLVERGCSNVIALRTFSKAYGLAGLRIGYLIADAHICSMLDRLREPFNMSRAATAAGPVALSDQSWLRDCQSFVWAGRRYLTEELTRLGFDVVPSQANFVLAGMRADAQGIYRRLLMRGVIVRPASGFGYPNHIRVTVGTDEQNHTLIAALEDLLRGQ
jgi:histidinol-phosphate aminotransferase